MARRQWLEGILGYQTDLHHRQPRVGIHFVEVHAELFAIDGRQLVLHREQTNTRLIVESIVVGVVIEFDEHLGLPRDRRRPHVFHRLHTTQRIFELLGHQTLDLRRIGAGITHDAVNLAERQIGITVDRDVAHRHQRRQDQSNVEQIHQHVLTDTEGDQGAHADCPCPESGVRGPESSLSVRSPCSATQLDRSLHTGHLRMKGPRTPDPGPRTLFIMV